MLLLQAYGGNQQSEFHGVQWLSWNEALVVTGLFTVETVEQLRLVGTMLTLKGSRLRY
jgi:hypothetical protein